MAAAPSFPTLSLPPIHLQPSPIFAPPHRLTVFSEFYNSSPHLSPHCWPDAESDGASSPQSLRYPVMWFHCIFRTSPNMEKVPMQWKRSQRSHTLWLCPRQTRGTISTNQLRSMISPFMTPFSQSLPAQLSLHPPGQANKHSSRKKKFVFLNNIF